MVFTAYRGESHITLAFKLAHFYSSMYCHLALAFTYLLASCLYGSWFESLLTPHSLSPQFSLAFPLCYILPYYRSKQHLLSTNKSNIYLHYKEGLSHTREQSDHIPKTSQLCQGGESCTNSLPERSVYQLQSKGNHSCPHLH